METNWYRIFPAKVLAVIACLPRELRPDFSLLIWVYLNEGSLPDNDAKIAFLSGLPIESIQALNPCLEFLGCREDGKLIIDFLEEIIAERKEFAQRKAAAGAKGGIAKARKAKQAVAVSSSAKQSQAQLSTAQQRLANPSHACMHVVDKSTTTCSEEDLSLTRAEALARDKSSSAAGAASQASSHSPDVIWDLAVKMLIRAGDKESQARTFLGKLCKDYTKESVAQAIATTSAANPANPKEYLVKILQKGNGRYPIRPADDLNAGGRGRLVQ